MSRENPLGGLSDDTAAGVQRVADELSALHLRDCFGSARIGFKLAVKVVEQSESLESAVATLKTMADSDDLWSRAEQIGSRIQRR